MLKQFLYDPDRTLPPKDCQCKGRKADLTQCTRKRKEGEDYCASHLKNLKNGSIDGENNEYIQMCEEEINGNLYLIDQDSNVYTHCMSSPELIGTKNNIGNIEYFNYSEKHLNP